jgi:hypothetical protein
MWPLPATWVWTTVLTAGGGDLGEQRVLSCRREPEPQGRFAIRRQRGAGTTSTGNRHQLIYRLVATGERSLLSRDVIARSPGTSAATTCP